MASLKHVRTFPWLTIVTVRKPVPRSRFGPSAFSGNEKTKWALGGNVAMVAFGFHANFNFFWTRLLERKFLGNHVGVALRKLVLDQTLAAPLAISAFYTGISYLDGKDDILEDWKNKFLNTHKSGLMYWPFVQFLNFVLIPPYVRTTFRDCCAFVWATFLCFSLQSGDGAMATALDWIRHLNGEVDVQNTSKSS